MGEIENPDAIQCLAHLFLSSFLSLLSIRAPVRAVRATAHLYIVCAFVPGAYSSRVDPNVDDGGAARLCERPRAPAAVPARSCAGSRTSSPCPPSISPNLPNGTSPSRLPTLPRCSTVFGDLAITDLVHRGVVADHRDEGRAEAVCRLHVEGRHAERAVAVIAEHFLLRMGELRGHREAGADAEAAERARIHPVAGPARPTACAEIVTTSPPSPI